MAEIRIPHGLWCCIIPFSLHLLLQLYPFLKLFYLTAIHWEFSSITSQIFHVLHFFFSGPQHETTKKAQFDFPISLFFSQHAHCLLLSKTKPLCCQRERAPSLMLDFKLSRYQVSIRKHSYQDSPIQSASIYSQTF